MGIADNVCFVLSLKQNMNFTITTSVITVDVNYGSAKVHTGVSDETSVAIIDEGIASVSKPNIALRSVSVEIGQLNSG